MDADVLGNACEAVRASWPDAKPRFGVVLGSGWGAVADALDPVDVWAGEAVPGWGRATVEGHHGRLLRVRVRGIEGLVFQGRRHWYEGLGWTPVAVPVYLLKHLGASMVLLTNAAGGLHPEWPPGTLMAIRDHIHAMGAHPLVGAHDPCWGARFPDQSAVYDPALREALRAAGKAAGVRMEEGVYLAVSGPTYETPAEVRAYRGWGADAVGMSTTPEAMLAGAAGLRVAGLSCLTNLAAGLSAGPLSHAEVSAVGQAAAGPMAEVVRRFLEATAS